MPVTTAARMADSTVPTSAPVTIFFAVGLGSGGSLTHPTISPIVSTMTNEKKETRKRLPPLGLEKSSGLTARGGAAKTSAAWIIEFMVCSFLPWWVGPTGPGAFLRRPGPVAGQTLIWVRELEPPHCS